MTSTSIVPMAFEGCACRAAFHVGVASWLDARGFRPSRVAGASSGSIVAALWSVGAVDVLRQLWLDLADRTVVMEPRRLLKGRWPGRMSHVLRAPLARFDTLKMMDHPDLRIVVTRLGFRGPRPVVLGPRDDVLLVDAILASCFIPGPYSRPVMLNGRLAVDGAWFERVPLSALPVGRRIAVTTGTTGTLTRGFPWVRRHHTGPDTRILAPLRPLPLWGFSFDGPSTVESMQIGEESVEAFVRDVGEDWLVDDSERD